jgi:hypothetical protein
MIDFFPFVLPKIPIEKYKKNILYPWRFWETVCDNSMSWIHVKICLDKSNSGTWVKLKDNALI